MTRQLLTSSALEYLLLLCSVLFSSVQLRVVEETKVAPQAIVFASFPTYSYSQKIRQHKSVSPHLTGPNVDSITQSKRTSFTFGTAGQYTKCNPRIIRKATQDRKRYKRTAPIRTLPTISKITFVFILTHPLHSTLLFLVPCTYFLTLLYIFLLLYPTLISHFNLCPPTTRSLS